MYYSIKNFRTISACLILFTIALAGCHHDPEGCNNITPGAIPQPSGTYLCQWNHAEMARADRENFVIFLYEWSAEPGKLTPNGREHLDCLGARLSQSNCPIVIESSNDDQLDAARRTAILNTLASKSGFLAPERVVVGRSEAEGLYGDEAAGVARRMLGNTLNGGGGGAAGGTGGGAGGGGATTGGGGGVGIY